MEGVYRMFVEKKKIAAYSCLLFSFICDCIRSLFYYAVANCVVCSSFHLFTVREETTMLTFPVDDFPSSTASSWRCSRPRFDRRLRWCAFLASSDGLWEIKRRVFRESWLKNCVRRGLWTAEKTLKTKKGPMHGDAWFGVVVDYNLAYVFNVVEISIWGA